MFHKRESLLVCKRDRTVSLQEWSEMKMLKILMLTICFFAFFFSLSGESKVFYAMEEVVPDTMPEDLELAIIPAPKEVNYQKDMIKIDREVALVCSDLESLKAGKEQIISLLGGSRNVMAYKSLPDKQFFTTWVMIGSFEEHTIQKYLAKFNIPLEKRSKVSKNEEGYILIVDYLPAEKRNVILICGSTFQSQFWGIQTLKQITYQNEKGEIYVRRVKLLDWPTFKLRGSKRAQVWEHAFKSNFRYSTNGGLENPSADISKKGFEEHFMNEWMPDVLLGKELDCSEKSVESFERLIMEYVNRGATGFCFHVDDQPMKLTEETDKKFQGSYEAAVCFLLNRLYNIVKKYAKDAKVFFIPQPYWTNTKYDKYASQMKNSGGLPGDMGLMLCGPEVTSDAIPWDVITEYRKAFGLTQTKALIYDNYLRSNCFKAIDERPSKLKEQILGVSPETGSATTRITRLDWAWNPEGYSEERSLMLACREIAGLKGWTKLFQTVHLSEGRLPLFYSSQEEAVSKWKKGTAELEKLMKELKEEEIKGRVKLPVVQQIFGKHVVNGVVDDIGLFSRALTQQEMESIRTLGLKKSCEEKIIPMENVIGTWLFDEEGKVEDYSQKQKAGIIKGAGIKWTQGKFGKGICLPGSNTFIEIPYDASLSLNAFTISCWVKLKETMDYQAILHKFATDGKRSYSLIVSRDTGIAYVDCFPVPGVEGKTKITDDKWHFLSASFDGERMKLFVDGKLEGEVVSKGGLATGNLPLTIGAIYTKEATNVPKGYAYEIISHLRSENKGVFEGIDDKYLENTFKFARAVRISQPPVIDGKLTERIWDEIPKFSGFCTAHNGKLVTPERQSVFSVCYDDKNLYIGIRNYDPDLPGTESNSYEGDILGDGLVYSKVKVLIDPGRTRKQCYEFTVDRYGNMRDAYYDVESDKSPQGKTYLSQCQKGVSIIQNGWDLELAIPFTSLNGQPRKKNIWGLNIWVWKHKVPALIWSNKIWWWGFMDTKQAGNLIFE